MKINFKKKKKMNALYLSILASSGTTLGASAILFKNKLSPKLISNINGFAAGVMLYISLVDIIGDTLQLLSFHATSLYVITVLKKILVLKKKKTIFFIHSKS